VLDIMLLAVLVVAIRGTGIGSIEIKPALYVYVVLVVGSFFVSLAMERVLLSFDNPLRDSNHLLGSSYVQTRESNEPLPFACVV